MSHDAVFHQGLHFLIRQNRPSEIQKEIQYSFRNMTNNPSIYACTMYHPDFIVCSFMENSIAVADPEGVQVGSLEPPPTPPIFKYPMKMK